MKIILFGIISFFVCVISIARSYGQTCKDLVDYRDVYLLKEFDEASQKYATLQGAKIDYTKIKGDLLDDTKWTASNWALLSALINSNIKITADLINDLLKFTPAGSVAGTGQSIANDVYNAIKTGKDLKSLFKNGAEQYVFEKIVSRAGKIGQAIIAAKSLSSNINSMAELPQSHAQLKADVKAAIENIETEMEKLNALMLSSDARISKINEYKAGIDKYLNEECGNVVYKSPLINLNYTVWYSVPDCTIKGRLLNIYLTGQYNRITEKFTELKLFFLKQSSDNHTGPCPKITWSPDQNQVYVLNDQKKMNNEILISFLPESKYELIFAKTSFTVRSKNDGSIDGTLKIVNKNGVVFYTIDIVMSSQFKI